MKKSRKILIGILICVIIGSVFYIGYYYVTQNKNEKVYKKLQKEVVKQESKEEEPQTEESHVEIPIDFAQLQAQNPDIYAWIQIDGTNINYPVAQSATDNEYYLNHNFYQEQHITGCVFADSSAVPLAVEARRDIRDLFIQRIGTRRNLRILIP